MAVPAGLNYIEKGYDISKLNKYLDWFNILSYDYHSAYEPSVNHHAPLYPLNDNGEDEYNFDEDLNIDFTIKYYLKAGADRDKLVLGIPTYGRSYTLIDELNTDIGAPSDGPGEQGDATREKGYLAYYEICQNLKNDNNWTLVQFNPRSVGPYAFRKNQWVGYDDEEIIKKKAEYVVDKGLGGIMFWSIDNDDFRGNCNGRPYPLIEAAKDAMLSKLGYNANEVIKAGKSKKPGRFLSQTNSSMRNRISGNNIGTYKSTDNVRQLNKKINISTTTSSTVLTRKVTSWLKITTPQPPTTPDPGVDFKCEEEGFYPHPRDCKKYYWCLDSGPSNLGIIAHQFTCPSGLYFNTAADSCDFTRNVLCKKNNKATTTKATTVLNTPKPISIKSTSSTKVITNIFQAPKLTRINSEDAEYEDEYDDENLQNVKEKLFVKDSEEDPKVIKELIILIKKAGGIEELEKLLQLDGQRQDDENKSFKNSKVTERQKSFISLKDRFSTLQALQRNNKSFHNTNEKQEDRDNIKYSSIVRNSRPRPQNDAIEKLPELEGILRKKPEYITLNRSRANENKLKQNTFSKNYNKTGEGDESIYKYDKMENAEIHKVSNSERANETEVTSTLSYFSIKETLPSTETFKAETNPSDSLIEISTTENNYEEQNSNLFNINRYKTITRPIVKQIFNESKTHDGVPSQVTVINTENNESIQTRKRKLIPYSVTDRRTTALPTQNDQKYNQQESANEQFMQHTNIKSIISQNNIINSPFIPEPIIETTYSILHPIKKNIDIILSTPTTLKNIDSTELPQQTQITEKIHNLFIEDSMENTERDHLLNLTKHDENYTFINSKLNNLTGTANVDVKLLEKSNNSYINLTFSGNGAVLLTKAIEYSFNDQNTTKNLRTISSPRPFSLTHRNTRPTLPITLLQNPSNNSLLPNNFQLFNVSDVNVNIKEQDVKTNKVSHVKQKYLLDSSSDENYNLESSKGNNVNISRSITVNKTKSRVDLSDKTNKKINFVEVIEVGSSEGYNDSYRDIGELSTTKNLKSYRSKNLFNNFINKFNNIKRFSTKLISSLKKGNFPILKKKSETINRKSKGENSAGSLRRNQVNVSFNPLRDKTVTNLNNDSSPFTQFYKKDAHNYNIKNTSSNQKECIKNMAERPSNNSKKILSKQIANTKSYSWRDARIGNFRPWKTSTSNTLESNLSAVDTLNAKFMFENCSFPNTSIQSSDISNIEENKKKKIGEKFTENLNSTHVRSGIRSNRLKHNDINSLGSNIISIHNISSINKTLKITKRKENLEIEKFNDTITENNNISSNYNHNQVKGTNLSSLIQNLTIPSNYNHPNNSARNKLSNASFIEKLIYHQNEESISKEEYNDKDTTIFPNELNTQNSGKQIKTSTNKTLVEHKFHIENSENISNFKNKSKQNELTSGNEPKFTFKSDRKVNNEQEVHIINQESIGPGNVLITDNIENKKTEESSKSQVLKHKNNIQLSRNKNEINETNQSIGPSLKKKNIGDRAVYRIKLKHGMETNKNSSIIKNHMHIKENPTEINLTTSNDNNKDIIESKIKANLSTKYINENKRLIKVPAPSTIEKLKSSTEEETELLKSKFVKGKQHETEINNTNIFRVTNTSLIQNVYENLKTRNLTSTRNKPDRKYRPILTADELSSLLAVDLTNHKNIEYQSVEPKVVLKSSRPIKPGEHFKNSSTNDIEQTQPQSLAYERVDKYKNKETNYNKFKNDNVDADENYYIKNYNETLSQNSEERYNKPTERKNLKNSEQHDKLQAYNSRNQMKDREESSSLTAKRGQPILQIEFNNNPLTIDIKRRPKTFQYKSIDKYKNEEINYDKFKNYNYDLARTSENSNDRQKPVHNLNNSEQTNILQTQTLRKLFKDNEQLTFSILKNFNDEPTQINNNARGIIQKKKKKLTNSFDSIAYSANNKHYHDSNNEKRNENKHVVEDKIKSNKDSINDPKQKNIDYVKKNFTIKSFGNNKNIDDNKNKNNSRFYLSGIGSISYNDSNTSYKYGTRKNISGIYEASKRNITTRNFKNNKNNQQKFTFKNHLHKNQNEHVENNQNEYDKRNNENITKIQPNLTMLINGLKNNTDIQNKDKLKGKILRIFNRQYINKTKKNNNETRFRQRTRSNLITAAMSKEDNSSTEKSAKIKSDSTAIGSLLNDPYNFINAENINSSYKFKNELEMNNKFDNKTVREMKADYDNEIENYSEDDNYDNYEETDNDNEDIEKTEEENNEQNSNSKQNKENNEKTNENVKINSSLLRENLSVEQHLKEKYSDSKSIKNSLLIGINASTRQPITNLNRFKSLDKHLQSSIKKNNKFYENRTNLLLDRLCQNNNRSFSVGSNNTFKPKLSSVYKTDVIGNDVNNKIFLLNKNRRFQSKHNRTTNLDVKINQEFESTTKYGNVRRFRVFKLKEPVTNIKTDDLILKSNLTDYIKMDVIYNITKIPTKEKLFISKSPLTTITNDNAILGIFNANSEGKKITNTKQSRRFKLVKKIIRKNDRLSNKGIANTLQAAPEVYKDIGEHFSEKHNTMNMIFENKSYLNRRTFIPTKPTELIFTSSKYMNLAKSKSVENQNLNENNCIFHNRCTNIQTGNSTTTINAEKIDKQNSSTLTFTPIYQINKLNRGLLNFQLDNKGQIVKEDLNENEHNGENNHSNNRNGNYRDQNDYDDDDSDNDNDNNEGNHNDNAYDNYDYNDGNEDNRHIVDHKNYYNYDDDDENGDTDKNNKSNHIAHENVKTQSNKIYNAKTEIYTSSDLSNSLSFNSCRNCSQKSVQNRNKSEHNISIEAGINLTTKKYNRYRANKLNNMSKHKYRTLPITSPLPITNQLSQTTNFPLTTPSIFKSTNTKLRKYTTSTSSTENTLKDDLLSDLNVNALNARNKKIFEITSKKHTTAKPKSKEQINILKIDTTSNETKETEILEKSEIFYFNNDLNNLQENTIESSVHGLVKSTEKPLAAFDQVSANLNEFLFENFEMLSTIETTSNANTKFTTIESEKKLVEINRVVEISSKENKLKLKSIGIDLNNIKTTDVTLIEPPHIDKLGEISRVKYVSLVKDQKEISSPKSKSEIYNETNKYNENILNGREKKGKKLVFPEVLRSIETSTIPLEGLFKINRKFKANNMINNSFVYASSLGETYVTPKSRKIDDKFYEIQNNKDYKENIETMALSIPFETTTTSADKSSNYVRPIVPLLRPESNESSPLVISIANLDKVILSKVIKSDTSLASSTLYQTYIEPPNQFNNTNTFKNNYNILNETKINNGSQNSLTENKHKFSEQTVVSYSDETHTELKKIKISKNTKKEDPKIQRIL